MTQRFTKQAEFKSVDVKGGGITVLTNAAPPVDGDFFMLRTRLRKLPRFSFPRRASYWWAEKKGELRLALRQWLGIEDMEAAITDIESRCISLQRSMQDGIDGCVEQINGLRTDVDADQSEYATNRAEDLKRLDELEANVQTLARQGAQLVNALNTATMLCAAWREVPLLKAAEAKAKAQAELRKQARDERTAEILKGASKNGTGVTVVEKPEGD